MVGSYHQFGAFVSGVASLPRVVILTMHDINLKPKDKATGNARSGALELSGTVKTYRYLDETEVQAQQAADAGRRRRSDPFPLCALWDGSRRADAGRVRPRCDQHAG